MKNFNSGFWAILGGAFIYGSFGILTRYMDIGFGNYTQVLVRALIASLIALVIIFINKNKLKFEKKDYLKMILLGIAYFLGTTAFTIGNISTKVSVMIFMLYVGSFTTTFLLSTFLFKEKITLTKIVSVVIVITGMLITLNFNISDLALGAFLGIFAGIT
ncbi:EamA family transporter, partial [Candidatus Dojkabacteria bacterium]|nr:EamA family transporter [Candidatus Dojkabacteria bacterium]